MSFDINIISKNLSNVQASAKSQDGGAGNTGYFAREQNEEGFNFHYKETGADVFDKKTINEEVEEETDLPELFLRFIEKLIKKIKKFFHSFK